MNICSLRRLLCLTALLALILTASALAPAAARAQQATNGQNGGNGGNGGNGSVDGATGSDGADGVLFSSAITVTGGAFTAGSGGNGGNIVSFGGRGGRGGNGGSALVAQTGSSVTVTGGAFTAGSSGNGGNGQWLSPDLFGIGGNGGSGGSALVAQTGSMVRIAGGTFTVGRNGSAGGGYNAGSAGGAGYDLFANGGAITVYGSGFSAGPVLAVSGTFTGTIGGVTQTLSYSVSSAAGSAIFLSSSPAPRILTVAQDGSGQYTRIQDAVNAAQDGDIVLVGDGTYSGDGNRDIDFHGKSLTVESVHGAASTIIDCGGAVWPPTYFNHRGFYLHGGELQAVISGFTVKKGVEIYDSSIPDSYYGGGIFVRTTGQGHVTVRDCVVSGNTANYGSVFNENDGRGTITLTNCTVTGNTTKYAGGVFNGNFKGSVGATITMTGCTVANNTAGAFGTDASYPGGGGGVVNENDGSGTITLTNCTITGNTTDQWLSPTNGGGVYNFNYHVNGATITLTGCTIAGNTASKDGGGVYNENSSGYSNQVITLTDCILYNDVGRFSPWGNSGVTSEVSNNASGGIALGHCDIQGSYPGTGNINADPLFDPNGLQDNGGPTQTIALLAGSPCLAAGTSVNGLTTDQRGVLRADPPDIGAFEGALTFPAATHLVVSAPATATVGSPVTVTVTAEDDDGNTASSYTGAVHLTSSDTSAALPAAARLTRGVGQFTVTFRTAGSQTVTATDTLTPSINGASGAITVSKNATATTLTSSANPSTVGDSVTFTATVSSAAGTPTGMVTFTLDGAASLGSNTLSGGKATLNTNTLPPGSHSITAIYSGDTTFAAGSAGLTQIVNIVTTTTTVKSSLNPSLVGQSVTFTATVAPTTGSAKPTGRVTFTLDGTAQAPVALTGGTAAFTPDTLAVGTHTLTAVYSGVTPFSDSKSATLTQVVNKNASTTALVSSANPSVVGHPVTFTATVSAAGTPTGTVTFTLDGAAQAPVPLSGATVSFQPAALGVGQHTVTAAYSGDAAFAVSSSPALTQIVNKNAATTALVSSANPSLAGDSVTFTATVSSAAGTPTGTVTFTDGTAVLGAVSLNDGKAALSTSSLAVGVHSITAIYSGDSGFTTSSTSLTQTVNPLPVNPVSTTVALTSSANPSLVGQSVTFTAVVTPTSGTGTPFGVVTFILDGFPQAPVALTGAASSFTTSGLAVGQHTVTAAYSGDSAFTGSSTADALTQTVNPQTVPPGVLHTFAPGLQMIAIPEDDSAVTLADAWAAPAGQVLATWSGTAYALGNALPTPGQGAWVRLGQNTALYDTGVHTPRSGSFSISLHAGWNLIGDPFPSAVAESALSVRTVQGTASLADSGAVVSPTLYTYLVGATDYQTQDLSGSLAPFQGYWLYAFQDSTLIVPPPVNP